MWVLKNNKTGKLEYHGEIDILGENMVHLKQKRKTVTVGSYEGYELWFGIPCKDALKALVGTNISCRVLDGNHCVSEQIDTFDIGMVKDFSLSSDSFIITTKNRCYTFLNINSNMIFIRSKDKEELDL